MITQHTSGLVHEAYLKLADPTRQAAHQRGTSWLPYRHDGGWYLTGIPF